MLAIKTLINISNTTKYRSSYYKVFTLTVVNNN